MEPEDIKIDDWDRIIYGLVPPVFLIEVVFRVLVVFIVLLISVRLLGNRLASDMSRLELITKVCLAAAMGIPLQSPENGLLPGIIVAFVTVLAARLISYISSKYRRFEIITQDELSVMVEDSVLHLQNMNKNYLCKERLFSQLRMNSIKHLGEVKRLYVEANGNFTLIKNDNSVPGLSVLPFWDNEMRDEQEYSDREVCCKCGKPRQNQEGECSNCGNNEFEKAMKGSEELKENKNRQSVKNQQQE